MLLGKNCSTKTIRRFPKAFLSVLRAHSVSNNPPQVLSREKIFDIITREHSLITSDFQVGRYVMLHLMISDEGRWVGQKGSDVRSDIFECLLFTLMLWLICRHKDIGNSKVILTKKTYFYHLTFTIQSFNLQKCLDL